VFALAVSSTFPNKLSTSTATFPFHCLRSPPPNLSTPRGALQSRAIFAREAVPQSKSSRPLLMFSRTIVTLVEQKASLISILGDVRPAIASATAGRQPASGSDMWVMLEREGRRALAPFALHRSALRQRHRKPRIVLMARCSGCGQVR
jgi:hypothetical protein